MRLPVQTAWYNFFSIFLFYCVLDISFLKLKFATYSVKRFFYSSFVDVYRVNRVSAADRAAACLLGFNLS